MLGVMVQRWFVLLAASVLLLLGGMFVYLATIGDRIEETADPLRSLGKPLWAVPQFQLVEAQGAVVENSDLRGKIWLAAFVFTRCPGPCPLISRRMSEMQARLTDVENFRLVSFTVDPEFDRPEVLRAYAQQWNADPQRWWFLTEDDPGELEPLVRGFGVGLQRGETLEEVPDITHGTNLLLVDGAGKVRAVFRSSDENVVAQVEQAVRRLSEATPPSRR